MAFSQTQNPNMTCAYANKKTDTADDCLYLSFRVPDALSAYAAGETYEVAKDLCAAFTHNVQRTILGWLDGHECHMTAIPATTNMTRLGLFQPEQVFYTGDASSPFIVKCFKPTGWDLQVEQEWFNTYAYYDHEDADGMTYDPNDLIIQGKSIFIKMFQDKIRKDTKNFGGFQFHMHGFTILATVVGFQMPEHIPPLLTFQPRELLDDTFTQWRTYYEYMDRVDNIKQDRFLDDNDWRRQANAAYLNGDSHNNVDEY
jgi:hypothetical protein